MLLATASNNGSNTNVHFIELENLKEESSCVLSSSKVDDLQFHPEKNALLACTSTSLIVAGWDPTGVHGKYYRSIQTPVLEFSSDIFNYNIILI